jgi:hypothetical protein
VCSSVLRVLGVTATLSHQQAGIRRLGQAYNFTPNFRSQHTRSVVLAIVRDALLLLFDTGVEDLLIKVHKAVTVNTWARRVDAASGTARYQWLK